MRCFLILRWKKFCSGCFRQVFFHLRDKKVVAGRVKQVDVLYSSNCMGTGLCGRSMSCLRRVVVLQKWSYKQVYNYLFDFIQSFSIFFPLLQWPFCAIQLQTLMPMQSIRFLVLTFTSQNAANGNQNFFLNFMTFNKNKNNQVLVIKGTNYQYYFLKFSILLISKPMDFFIL